MPSLGIAALLSMGLALRLSDGAALRSEVFATCRPNPQSRLFSSSLLFNHLHKVEAPRSSGSMINLTLRKMAAIGMSS